MGAAWRVEGTRSSIRSAFVLFYFKHKEGGQRETLLSAVKKLILCASDP